MIYIQAVTNVASFLLQALKLIRTSIILRSIYLVQRPALISFSRDHLLQSNILTRLACTSPSLQHSKSWSSDLFGRYKRTSSGYPTVGPSRSHECSGVCLHALTTRLSNVRSFRSALQVTSYRFSDLISSSRA